MILPTIYISDPTWFNQQSGNRAAIAQRLINPIGSHTVIILEFKGIIALSIWTSAWVVLVLEVFGWFL